MTDFEQVVSKELTDDQKNLLASMMGKLAACDGNIDPFEADFLQSFLGGQLGDELGSAIRNLPTLDDEEIASRASGATDTIYLFCTLLSCVDEHVDEKELETLNRFGKALGLEENRRDELNSIARRQVLNQCADAMNSVPGDADDKGRALAAVGERIRATESEIKEVQVKYELTVGPAV